MKKGFVRLIFIIFALIIVISIFAFFLRTNVSKNTPEIDFLDVGQGDSILLKLPNNKRVLIDGGPDNLVIRRLGEYLPFYQRKIDYIIVSHFHDDHIIGLIEIIRRYQVGAIIYINDFKETGISEALFNKAREKQIKLISLKSEININYSAECSINILNPLILGVKIDDNNSLITRLNCQKLSALFTGDNSLAVEAALLNTDIDLGANILKASHHGSKSANLEAFLRRVGPEYFVISVGADNRFGHPFPEILKLVNALNIKVKRTDLDKTIRINK